MLPAERVPCEGLRLESGAGRQELDDGAEMAPGVRARAYTKACEIDRRRAVLLGGDVALEDLGGAALGRDRLGGVRRGRAVTVEEHHPRPLAREGLGDLLADAARGAGHDGNFVPETHVTHSRDGRLGAQARPCRMVGDQDRRL